MPRLPVKIGQEPWQDIWPEVNKLAEAHSCEVDGGIEPRRQFALDFVIMQAMSDAGVLKIWTARQERRLIGYLTWNISFDVESAGLIIAQQGAWFVSSASGFQRIGIRLMQRSLHDLKAMGVKCTFPHHRLQGRGAGLGKFFGRLGAQPMQMTYVLWIGD